MHFIFQYSQINRKFKRTAFIRNKIFCNIINVICNQYKASMLNKSILLLTLWLCSGQIDPKKIFFFPKILVNVIALDSNLLALFT